MLLATRSTARVVRVAASEAPLRATGSAAGATIGLRRETIVEVLREARALARRVTIGLRRETIVEVLREERDPVATIEEVLREERDPVATIEEVLRAERDPVATIDLRRATIVEATVPAATTAVPRSMPTGDRGATAASRVRVATMVGSVRRARASRSRASRASHRPFRARK